MHLRHERNLMTVKLHLPHSRLAGMSRPRSHLRSDLWTQSSVLWPVGRRIESQLGECHAMSQRPFPGSHQDGALYRAEAPWQHLGLFVLSTLVPASALSEPASSNGGVGSCALCPLAADGDPSQAGAKLIISSPAWVSSPIDPNTRLPDPTMGKACALLGLPPLLRCGRGHSVKQEGQASPCTRLWVESRFLL